MLALSEATLPEHSFLGNMQIFFSPFVFSNFSVCLQYVAFCRLIVAVTI